MLARKTEVRGDCSGYSSLVCERVLNAIDDVDLIRHFQKWLGVVAVVAVAAGSNTFEVTSQFH